MSFIDWLRIQVRARLQQHRFMRATKARGRNLDLLAMYYDVPARWRFGPFAWPIDSVYRKRIAAKIMRREYGLIKGVRVV